MLTVYIAIIVFASSDQIVHLCVKSRNRNSSPDDPDGRLHYSTTVLNVPMIPTTTRRIAPMAITAAQLEKMIR